MSDYKLNSEEARNLIAMLKSSDKSNQDMAEVLLDSLSIKDNLEYVFVIIVFSEISESFWNKDKFYEILCQRFGRMGIIENKNISKLFTILSNLCPPKKDKDDVVVLFHELYFEKLLKNLNKYGYDFMNPVKIVKK